MVQFKIDYNSYIFAITTVRFSEIPFTVQFAQLAQEMQSSTYWQEFRIVTLRIHILYDKENHRSVCLTNFITYCKISHLQIFHRGVKFSFILMGVTPETGVHLDRNTSRIIKGFLASASIVCSAIDVIRWIVWD